MELIKDGGYFIQNEVNEAVKNGTFKAVISGNYEIEKTVLIPSGFYLVLDNCYLRMADDSFCNMFTNENCRTEIGRTKEGTDRNIVIEGKGNTILDGGTYNGLGERNSLKDGNPHISVNNMILFANVDGFSISGLKIRNHRWWAMNFLFCGHGKIRDIDFCSNPIIIDENGNEKIGFQHGPIHDQAPHLVKNGDGIDLRAGCHDIIIENITGFCEEDTIAFTGLNGNLEAMYAFEGASTDMYNLIVRNVNASSYCAIVRLLNQSGVKLFNVLIDGVYDSSRECEYMDMGMFGIRIGDTRMYGTRHATEDECFNITVKNLFTRARDVLNIAGSMKNVRLENIKGFDDYKELIVNNSTLSDEELLAIV